MKKRFYLVLERMALLLMVANVAMALYGLYLLFHLEFSGGILLAAAVIFLSSNFHDYYNIRRYRKALDKRSVRNGLVQKIRAVFTKPDV